MVYEFEGEPPIRVRKVAGGEAILGGESDFRRAMEIINLRQRLEEWFITFATFYILVMVILAAFNDMPRGYADNTVRLSLAAVLFCFFKVARTMDKRMKMRMASRLTRS